MVSIPATQPKSNLHLVSESTFPKLEVHNNPQPDHYKQMWQHERNRRIEVEQENIRLRKMIYNPKFSLTERAVAIEIADQVKEARHVDEQGRKLFSKKNASERLAVSRSTIDNAIDILTESEYITDKDTKPLRDKDGKLVKSKDGMQIKTIHLNINQDLYEDFSKAERSTPRKIGKDRKVYTYQCQECLTEDITIETDRYLVCKNSNCKKCGQRVLIDTSYKDQPSEQPPTNEHDPLMHKICVSENSEIPYTQNLGIIEDDSNNAQNLCIGEIEDDSNNPPGTSPTTILQSWLTKRRGTPRIIWATGSTQACDKYLSKGADYQPDIEAFIAGKIGHIYGSWLRDPQTGLTWILSFDCDTPEHDAQAQNYLLDLARAGGSAIYWVRNANERRRGHLELHFDRPVDPDMAYQWAISVCPELEDIPECYPCKTNDTEDRPGQDKRNNALSWPLWQRIGGEVFPCTAYAILPAPHAAGMQEVGPTDLETLAQLVTDAVTPAALVEEFAIKREKMHPRGKDENTPHGGVTGKKPPVITQVGSNRDLVKQVIADFNRDHPWEEIAALCGGMTEGKFCAVWRGERTPSVAINRDGVLAHDYGKSGGFPSTFDQYQAYCLIHDIDKKADLAERCAALRNHQQAVGNTPQEPTTELFPIAKPQGPVHASCVVCGTPKTVWDPEREAFTCGSH